MTEGNPLVLILRFAVPLFIGNIFQQIYNLVDTMIAGYNLGDNAIAAIGATSSVFSLLVNFASGMNSGYGIIVAQSFGAKNIKKLKKSIATMAILNTAVTLLLTALSLVFIRPIMRAMNIPDNIFEDAYAYIGVILGGLIATIIYNMFAGIMRSLGNSRTPLYILILSSALNLGMDVLFVVGLKWGVKGAAAATVIAQGVSALWAGVYILKNYPELLPASEHFRPDLALVKQMTSTGFAMAAMICVVDIGSVLYQRAINSLGEVLIVAHTTSRRILGMLMMPLGSIATAYSTFVGQNFGAGKMDRIRQTLKRVMALEVGWGVISCTLILLFGGTVVVLLTDTSDALVVDNAVLSLRTHILCFPALGVLLALRTALQAMGQKLIPVISSGFELAIKIAAGMWLIPAYGYMSACLTEPVIWIVSMTFLIVAFAFKKPLKETQIYAPH